MSAADRLYARLAPYHAVDAENGLALQKLIEGLAAPLEILETARDTDTHIAWGSILDPDSVDPRLLPWLAQFTGDRLTPGQPVQQQRDQLTSPNNFIRGTEAAIRAAVEPTLTGAKTVLILPRTTSAWTLTVVVRTSECPDPAASERAARSQKATGLVMAFVTSDLPIVDEGGAARTLDAIGSAGTQIDQVTVSDWS